VRGYTAYAGRDGRETLSANEQPRAVDAGIKVAQAAPTAPDQTDDLLNPTEEELRGIAAPEAQQPEAAAGPPANASPIAPHLRMSTLRRRENSPT
jgi:hypothetical protein